MKFIKLNLQKGAMFGLDARIALAIFGALSVISGAALYSAIQNAKTVKELAIFREVSKAVEQYILDTGSYLPENASNSNSMNLGDLFTNYINTSGWNGPYIGTDSPSAGKIYINFTGNSILDKYAGISGRRSRSSDWSGTDEDGGDGCSAGDCSLYLYSYIGSSNAAQIVAKDYLANMFVRMDEYVDGGDGTRKGNIRATITTSSTTFYYKAMPEKLYLNNPGY
jgi:type II secretory pathway pseudopilin PulG